jgi:hypothetical protein
MPSQIAVLTGPAVGTVFPIEESVIRIGSDPQCSIRLTDIPPHAVTLRFQDGRFQAFNRSGHLIELEGTAIPDGKSADWEAGQDLQLSTDVILQLQIDGDPRPAKRHAPTAAHVSLIGADADEVREEMQDGIDDDEDESTKAGGSGIGSQLAILGLLLVAFVGILVADELFNADSVSSLSEKEIQEKYDLLVADIDRYLKDDALPADRPQWEMLRTLLQDSRIEEVRGHSDEAAAGYQRLRHFLLSQRNQAGVFAGGGASEAPAPTSDLDEFASDRLAELGSPSL